MNRVPALRLCAQFYLESKKKTRPLGVRACWPKRYDEKGGPQPNFASFLFMFLSLPLGLPCVNWARQECCLFYLRSLSLWSSDLLVLFSLPCLFATDHSGHVFPHSNHQHDYYYYYFGPMELRGLSQIRWRSPLEDMSLHVLLRLNPLTNNKRFSGSSIF